MKTDNIRTRLLRTAANSPCKYRVGAIGLNARGVPIKAVFNAPRFSKRGGGRHAELRLMKECPKSLRTIIIVRLGKGNGGPKPIHPCKTCKTQADQLGIKIVTIK